MNLLTFLLQLNSSLVLQSIGLTVLQAIFQAPVYALAVYWGLRLAVRHEQRHEIAVSKLQNKENN